MALRHVKSQPIVQSTDDGDAHVLPASWFRNTVEKAAVGQSLEHPIPTPEHAPSDAQGAASASIEGASEEIKEHGWPSASRLDNVVPRQLSLVIEAVEEILLVRTRLEYQFSTIALARSFLESSLDALEPCLAEANESNSGMSMQSIIDESARGEDQPIVVQGAGIYIGKDEDVPTEPGATRSVPALTRLSHSLAKFREELARVREEEKVLSRMIDGASKKEYRLNERHKAMLALLRNPERATEILGHVTSRDGQSLLPSESVHAASDIPSLVQQYFERCGDIGVLRERQDELRENYDEGVFERELIAERGDELEVTDEDFNKTFRERDAEFERELEVAQQEAKLLRESCLAAGHDIEQYRISQRSPSLSESSEDQTMQQILAPNHPRNTSQGDVIVSGFARKPSRAIGEWLRTVPVDDVDTAAMAEELSHSTPI